VIVEIDKYGEGKISGATYMIIILSALLTLLMAVAVSITCYTLLQKQIVFE